MGKEQDAGKAEMPPCKVLGKVLGRFQVTKAQPLPSRCSDSSAEVKGNAHEGLALELNSQAQTWNTHIVALPSLTLVPQPSYILLLSAVSSK